ncbi:hypothetical protein [Streptosporangium minutum]|uniref:Uncharacterized protein n=1 Tax=Streptosporangium minutum TaxID=569862 RepID=A0A243R9D2_9ACTN|nr:hypothetical protein [Streptosporangium minutum]OUC91216.1 hypothetical protein CA984_34530 [Streptosporangium minutum]
MYVVSRATAEQAIGRNDVVYPDLQVRTQKGTEERIVGCRALARVKSERAEPDSYDDYTLADPRGILRGERWENRLDGTTVAVLPPRLAELFGFVAVTVSGKRVELDGGSSQQMAEALAYARVRAAHQQCPMCSEDGEPTAADSRMWRCPNGHVFDAEAALERLRPCRSCGGYGVS